MRNKPGPTNEGSAPPSGWEPLKVPPESAPIIYPPHEASGVNPCNCPKTPEAFFVGVVRVS